MLKSFVEFDHPLDGSITYAAATFDPNGAQALLWSAMDLLTTDPERGIEAEAEMAAYCLDAMPDNVRTEAELIGRLPDWRSAEAILQRFGNKVLRVSRSTNPLDYWQELPWLWEWEDASTVNLVGARARGLARSLSYACQTLSEQRLRRGMAGQGQPKGQGSIEH